MVLSDAYYDRRAVDQASRTVRALLDPYRSCRVTLACSDSEAVETQAVLTLNLGQDDEARSSQARFVVVLRSIVGLLAV